MRLIYQGKFEAAIEYLLLALRFSHPKAVYTLGTLYEFGKGTAQNKDDAYNYYRIAKSLGFADDRSAYKLKILKMLK